MRIVITGNIGSGKSTVVKQLMPQISDYDLFDFDETVKQMYQLDHFKDQLKCLFGTNNKAEVSDIVHRDVFAMQKLEDMSNQLLVEATRQAALSNKVVLDIPLFFEHERAWEIKPDLIVCVTCPREIRFGRVKVRNGFSDDKIDSIMEKQLTDHQKAERSHWVICNDGTIQELAADVERLAYYINKKGLNDGADWSDSGVF